MLRPKFSKVAGSVILFCCFTTACSQTLDRWAQVVGWDGISSWKRYMITQPAFLGPNALPVPRVGNGTIDSLHHVTASVTGHFSPGDNTQNLTLYGNYAMVKDRISFDVMWVPYEHFVMSTAVKEKRHVFTQFFYDRQAMGELHLNTNFQLLSRWRKDIHLALRVGYRIPCGSHYGAARFTDAPGYYADLNFGRPFRGSAFKLTGMLGFYVWHMESDQHRQNDSFLFGAGLEWNRGNWRLQTNVAGYLGYMYKSGDKPVVCRLNAEKKGRRTALLLGLQRGLRDFAYTSMEGGVKYFIKGKKP